MGAIYFHHHKSFAFATLKAILLICVRHAMPMGFCLLACPVLHMGWKALCGSEKEMEDPTEHTLGLVYKSYCDSLL
jgi:hypothetical protein